VLMDIQMPVMDGLEAARVLLAGGYAAPLVALTANVMPEDVARYAAAGFRRCIAKPIDVAAFAGVLAGVLEQAAGRAARAAMADIPGYDDIRSAWRASLDGRLDTLQSLLACGDLAQAAALSHTLRGSGGTFGYTGVTRLAGDIEMAAGRGDGAAATAALARLLALDELGEPAGAWRQDA
jgi:CheY-like chemotaxis protein